MTSKKPIPFQNDHIYPKIDFFLPKIRNFNLRIKTTLYFLPYDRALIKVVAPHAMRLAFHMNMGKSDGCIDMINPFSTGLQNFTTKVEENHKFYQKMFSTLKNVYEAEQTGFLNGTGITLTNPETADLHKVSERECARNRGDDKELCSWNCREESGSQGTIGWFS